jgi:hypothetical protein
MRDLAVMVFLGALVATGCGHKHAAVPDAGFTPLGSLPSGTNTAPSAPKITVTPEAGLQGKVVRTNSGGRFVVLNFPIGHLPALDQHLSVYRLGLKVGEVRVTGPQLDDNIVGDVVAGEAAVGDLVRDR